MLLSLAETIHRELKHRNPEAQEVPHEDRQELYCAGDKVLEQAAQRDCGVSFPADIHETSGHNLVQHSLGYAV